MKYTNSAAIIRTCKGNTVGAHLVITNRYQATVPRGFDYKGYCCDSFDIYESIGEDVVICTFQEFQHSGLTIRNTIRFHNVTKIEMFSEHEV